MTPRISFRLSFVLLAIFLLPSQVLGQAAEPFFRFGVLEMSAMRFEKPHIFEQMTGHEAFKEPDEPVVTSFSYLDRMDGIDESLFQKIWRFLPPVSAEYVIPELYLFDASFFFYHTAVFIEDLQVGALYEGKTRDMPIVKLKNYMEFLGTAAHLNASGFLDLHFGFALISMSGAYEWGFRANEDTGFERTSSVKGFNSDVFIVNRMGIDFNSETAGARFAIYSIGDRVIIENNEFFGNELTPDAQQEISFESIWIRVALLLKF